MVPEGLRGAAYGLRQALDTVGAFAGPLIAIALMAALHDNFRLIDEAPAPLRATAFGLFNFASGIVFLLANIMAGFLWQHIGPSATIIAGAVFTALGLSLLLLLRRSRPSPA